MGSLDQGLLLIEEDQVMEYLCELNIHKPMDTDVMHLSVEKAPRCHCKNTFGTPSMIMESGSDI